MSESASNPIYLLDIYVGLARILDDLSPITECFSYVLDWVESREDGFSEYEKGMLIASLRMMLNNIYVVKDKTDDLHKSAPSMDTNQWNILQTEFDKLWKTLDIKMN